MLSNYYIGEILGIKDANIIKIEHDDKIGSLHIYFELERNIYECPRCKELTMEVHDYRWQEIKGPPIGHIKLLLHYHKRRYRCSYCGKRFYEPNNFVPKYHRMTYSLEAFILEELRSNHTVKSIANRCNVSVFTINRIFDFISLPKAKLPRVLSIDEFRGNTGGEKFQCILADPKNHKVVDILPGRTSHYLTEYFRSFSKKEREKVEIVIMDMTRYYKNIVECYFPNAMIVADKFHYTRLVYWAFDKVRKEVQKSLHPQRRKYFKRSKSLLWKHRSKLNQEELDAVEVMLSLSPKLSNAYLLKERFLEFLAAEDVSEAKKRLGFWFALADSCGLQEFYTCRETLFEWLTPVLNSFKTPYTNGFTEGCNNKIKVLKRNAYGYRNYHRFRSRILYMFAA
ncbi:MAG: ISL3 family transposase [Zhaonellaceae bacterium]